jgi:hypothetical protein
VNHLFLQASDKIIDRVAVEVINHDRRQHLLLMVQDYLFKMKTHRTYYGILCAQADRWNGLSHGLLFVCTLFTFMLILALISNNNIRETVKLPAILQSMGVLWAFTALALCWVVMNDTKDDWRLKRHIIKRGDAAIITQLETLEWDLKFKERVLEEEFQDRWKRLSRDIAHILAHDPENMEIWKQAEAEENQRLGRKT